MQEILQGFGAIMLYGIIHSLLAALGIKSLFRKLIGERAYQGWYMLFFNVIAVILLLPVLWLLASDSDETIWRIDAPWRYALLAVQAVGLIGLALSLLQIDGMRFLGVRQALTWLRGDSLPLPSETLQTSGVYALVRHPLYLFTLMVIWPVATMTATWFGFCLGATLYFVIGSRLEEQKLHQFFGEAYENYRARTPWLIPFVKFG